MQINYSFHGNEFQSTEPHNYFIHLFFQRVKLKLSCFFKIYSLFSLYIKFSTMWIYHAFFDDFLIDEPLCCSQSFPGSNNAIVNNMLYKSLPIFARMSLGYDPRSEIVEIRVNTLLCCGL